MPQFYALVDAMTGREADVEKALAAETRVAAFVRCKERNHDFLVRLDAAGFDVVDDLLQTYVRSIKGVVGVEVITDFALHSALVAEAKKRLG